MRILILSRYSSNLQREDSCTDQERKVREHLVRSGIDVSAAEVLRDEAQSGETENRPCYLKIKKMIDAGEVFLLAVDEQSRLGRTREVSIIIDALVYNGGRFISIAESIDTDQEGWELPSDFAEMHHRRSSRETARRVRRGQEGRVLDGNGSAGDFPYGYHSEYVDGENVSFTGRGPKPKKKVVVDDEQAGWVRQVFEWFVGGWSISRITRELNAQNVPKGHRSTKPGWHHAQVRRIVANKKYIGVWEWGKTKTIVASGKPKKQIPVDSEEAVVVERPDLRIIDEGLWQAGQDRIEVLASIYGRKDGQKKRGPRPHHSKAYPTSILGGLLFCSLCGSRLVHQSGGTDVYYGCPRRRKGTCDLMVRVPKVRGEQELLDLVQHMLENDPSWVGNVLEAARVELSRLSKDLPAEVKRKRKRADDCQKKIDNLVEAIGAGGSNSKALAEKVSSLEGELATIEKELHNFERLNTVKAKLPGKKWIAKQLKDLAGVLRDDEQQAALILREVIGEVKVHQVDIPGKKRGYPRLVFNMRGLQTLQHIAGSVGTEALGVVDKNVLADAESCEEITLDLSRESRMDTWAPKIHEMKQAGKTWEEIGMETDLGAYYARFAWERWYDAIRYPEKPESA